jgi:hypothetical protein
MAAATFAHGGLGSGRNFQFGTALETTDAPKLDGGLWGFWDLRSFWRFFFQTEVGAAFFTDGGVTAARFLLLVAALGASR